MTMNFVNFLTVILPEVNPKDSQLFICRSFRDWAAYLLNWERILDF